MRVDILPSDMLVSVLLVNGEWVSCSGLELSGKLLGLEVVGESRSLIRFRSVLSSVCRLDGSLSALGVWDSSSVIYIRVVFGFWEDIVTTL